MAVATLLPFPRAVFFDANGNPLNGGLVHTYIPSTTTPKATWQDAAQATANANPIVLDSVGSCLLYGSGAYQLTTTDALGNAIAGYSGVVATALSQTAFATMALLRANAAAATAGAIISLGGFYVAGDGGGGVFVFVASDTTSADNGGTIIVDAFGNRWYRQTQGAPLNILWFGGHNDATGDNLGPYGAMLAVAGAQTGGANILFTPGKYAFSANAGFNHPAGRVFALSISGPGAVLYWPNLSGGLAFSFSLAGHTVALDGMHITTGKAAGGNGLGINQTDPLLDFFQCSVRNVVFRGDDNNGHTGGNFYWTNAAAVNNVSGTSWDTVTCYGSGAAQGIGLLFGGTGVGGPSGINYSIYHNIAKSIFNSLAVGVEYSSYAQGITIAQTNFQNTGVGLFVPSGATGLLSQLQIGDSQFACTGGGIVTLSAVGNVQINNCDIFGAINSAAIFLNVSFGANITGNNISVAGATGSQGILIDADSSQYPSAITGNTINDALNGVQINAGAYNTLVSGNSFTNCTNPVSDSGHNSNISGNLGIATVSSAPSPGASPWAYTAGSRPEALYLSASTSINSITQVDATSILAHATTANQPYSLFLQPYMAVSIGYTGTLTAVGSRLQ